MIKIGLVGEDPNDTKSISNLLGPSLEGKARFIPLLKRVRGHQLDNCRTGESLKIEVRDYEPDVVVFIRDADCTATEEAKMKLKLDWYHKLAKNVGKPKTLLLNIYELEALIFADIATFNRLYHTDIKFQGDVTRISEPKEKLKEKTWKLNKRFDESHCPQIFSELDLATVQNRCPYFKAFVSELNVLIAEV